MTDKPETEIKINLSGSAAPRPRYMYVLFTLEHRAYSIDEACDLAEKLKADGVDDLHCVKLDMGEPPMEIDPTVFRRVAYAEGDPMTPALPECSFCGAPADGEDLGPYCKDHTAQRERNKYARAWDWLTHLFGGSVSVMMRMDYTEFAGRKEQLFSYYRRHRKAEEDEQRLRRGLEHILEKNSFGAFGVRWGIVPAREIEALLRGKR